jgi:hypothetical protein
MNPSRQVGSNLRGFQNVQAECGVLSTLKYEFRESIGVYGASLGDIEYCGFICGKIPEISGETFAAEFHKKGLSVAPSQWSRRMSRYSKEIELRWMLLLR